MEIQLQSRPIFEMIHLFDEMATSKIFTNTSSSHRQGVSLLFVKGQNFFSQFGCHYLFFRLQKAI